MSFSRALASRFERSFALYRDFLESLEEASLREKLPGLPSNAIGLQLWCVVGARESYSRAIGAGTWEGFYCSLESVTVKDNVAAALRGSEEKVKEVILGSDGFSSGRLELALDLLEHEAAHHGQLIRYLYGLRLPIPDSWQARYALASLR